MWFEVIKCSVFLVEVLLCIFLRMLMLGLICIRWCSVLCQVRLMFFLLFFERIGICKMLFFVSVLIGFLKVMIEIVFFEFL